MPDQPGFPELTNASLDAAAAVVAVDELGRERQGQVAAERPLTLYLDKRELVTLMTLGTCPELLVLGWLRNQRMIRSIEEIRAVQVDWETESAAVATWRGVRGLEDKLSHRTVTTGCGQGTVFGSILDDLEHITLPEVSITQSHIYRLLRVLGRHNEVYRRAGAVHGCALCEGDAIRIFVEDVGRHNAVDAIAGHMWLHDIQGGDKIFYTTGRLTSEMVIKVAQMGIPVLLSRSGVTQMGLELARRVGVILIARAKGEHFLIYNGAERVILDAMPSPKNAAARR